MGDDLPVPKDPATVAIEKGIDVAAETAQRYLDPLLAPGAAEGGGIIKDTIASWRFKNQIRLVLNMKQFLEARGLNPKKLLPKTAYPILEAGSLETESDMQERWAALLAHAALDPDAISPAFPRILAELSPLDARILQFVYDATKASGRHPTEVSWNDALAANDVTFPDSYRIPDTGDLTSDNPVLGSTVHNLTRLQLIETRLTEHYLLNVQVIATERIRLTPFGFMFVRACTPP